MAVKKIVEWSYVIGDKRKWCNDIVFTKEMLVDFIGEHWFIFFFDKADNFIYSLDYIIATARELGKTYVVCAIYLYLIINDPLANFVLTRKYGSASGSFYEMISQVLNDFEEKYKITFTIKFSEEIPGTKKKKNGKVVKDDEGNTVYNKPTYKTIKEIDQLKGRGKNCLFGFGTTGNKKPAIFFNSNYDSTKNQIMFLIGADDADGSRGISPNIGYILSILLEEYSQEVDKGKLDPDEQVTRYKSLFKSSSRYSTKAIEKYKHIKDDFRTSTMALANIWDRDHQYNKSLLRVIPEDEWRKFVLSDPENNFWIQREHGGIVYVRGTTAANFFLYPKGSPAREALIKKLIAIGEGFDDYDKAESLGFTFPGFLKNDNPLQSIILEMMDSEEMELEDFKKNYEITTAEYGTDPGLRDAWCSVPAYLGEHKEEASRKIYINDPFIIDNAQRRKEKKQPIPNPILKNLQLEFWQNDLKNIPINIREFLEVNMDMRALAIRDDFNYEIFPRAGINGQCVSIPSQDSQGYGLEQRPDVLASLISKMVFSPMAKTQILMALKTLEPYAPDKKQPHPRKGKIDLYDALCYAIVKLRAYVN